MESLIKADIFFFVTTLLLVMLALMCAVGIFYMVKLIRNLFYISKTAREEVEKVTQDIEDLRKEVREGGEKIKNDMLYISHKIRDESEDIINDVHSARENVKGTAGWMKNLFTFFGRFSTMKSKKERSRSITKRSSSNKKQYGRKKQKK